MLCPGKPPPKPRHATLRALYHPADTSKNAEVLDSAALVLFFPAPETVTGEDVLEFHVHGGNAVVKAVLSAIPKAITFTKRSKHSIRYAEPGEFTRRAFYNNRLDLTHVEALGDTLSAETEQQRRLAVRGTTSTLADQYESWREHLLHARGVLEALIDFSEDQHFDDSPIEILRPLTKQVQLLKMQLRASIQNATRGELLRNGISIALVGAPNAGKSSLLNRIVGREAAIVSGEEGTTRDVIDVGVDIGGFFCRFGDLAGLRADSYDFSTPRVGEVEREGMRRAKDRALHADVVIVVLSVEPNHDEGNNDPHAISINSEVEETIRQCNPATQTLIYVINKADLLIRHTKRQGTAADFSELTRHQALKLISETSRLPVYAVSCKEAQNHHPAVSSGPDPGGIQALLQGLTENFISMTVAVLPETHAAVSANSSIWIESLGASERQRILLQQCHAHLETFLADVGEYQDGVAPVGTDDDKERGDVDVVLAAESLRAAAGCLAKITGKGEAGDVEEVLGVVFEK